MNLQQQRKPPPDRNPLGQTPGRKPPNFVQQTTSTTTPPVQNLTNK